MAIRPGIGITAGTEMFPVTTVTASTAGTSGDTIIPPVCETALIFSLEVSDAAAAAADTLDVKIQTRLDGTNWFDIVYFPQVLGNGANDLNHIEKLTAHLDQASFSSDTALTAGNTRDLWGGELRVRFAAVEDVASMVFTFGVTVYAL